MSQPKISIIIPAYNAQNYIERCLNSIVSQSIFSELEVIVINDGSQDDTKKIVESYSEKYNNILLENITNSGVSQARNTGLQKANGIYISFVDADDWVDQDYYATVYQYGEHENVDIIATGFFVNYKNGKQFQNILTNNFELMNNEESIKAYVVGNLDVHVVDKIFKRNLVNGIRFNEKLSIAEDRLFLFKCLEKAQKVACLNKCYYHYYQNISSTMNQEFDEKNIDSLTVDKMILKEITHKYPALIPYAQCMVINTECRVASEINTSRKKKKFNGLYKILKEDILAFDLKKSIKFSSKKHWMSLLIFKINPRIYGWLRGNTFLKLKK